LNSRFKREKLYGLEATDALVEHLKEKGIHYTIKSSQDNCTECLFIALPSSIQLALKNQDIILVDNTYKTNKFDMPLLRMVGECCYKFESFLTGPYRSLQVTYRFI
jgi:hypothetical protein